MQSDNIVRITVQSSDSVLSVSCTDTAFYIVDEKKYIAWHKTLVSVIYLLSVQN